MTETEKEMTICMACMFPNFETVGFCRKCGAAFGAASTLDPLQTVQAEGFMWRKATTRRPKFIVLLGTWILFAPWIPGIILLEISIILNWTGFGSLIFFWIGIALFLVALDILITVTKNYLTMPAK